MPERGERSGRETRLLALVIVVALAALLILARFRFPAAEISAVRPQQGPLERLVARSTYEDLAASVASLVQRVSSSVVVLQIQSIPPPAPEPVRGREPPPAPEPISRLVAGARVDRDLAVVHVPHGFQVTAGQGLAAPVEVLRVDDARQLVLVRAQSILEITSVLGTPFDAFPGFSYVGVVEAAIGGITAKPVFVGRADVSSDPRWPAPIVVVGGSSDAPPGSLVFALDGRFIGMTLPFGAGSRALIPPATLAAVAAELERAAATPEEGKTPPGIGKTNAAGRRGGDR
jgi:hypothetical protein